MQVTIKETAPSLENSSNFTIIINQKNSIQLEKGKKRTIIFNKSTKIKVKKHFFESNEIEVTESCLVEIGLNYFCLCFQFLLISTFIYFCSFYNNSILKSALLFIIILICMRLKKNWYHLTKVKNQKISDLQ